MRFIKLVSDKLDKIDSEVTEEADKETVDEVVDEAEKVVKKVDT